MSIKCLKKSKRKLLGEYIKEQPIFLVKIGTKEHYYKYENKLNLQIRGINVICLIGKL